MDNASVQYLIRKFLDGYTIAMFVTATFAGETTFCALCKPL